MSTKREIAGPTAAERMRAREAKKRSSGELGAGLAKRKTKKMKTSARAKQQQKKSKKKATSGLMSYFTKKQKQKQPREIINTVI